MGAVVGLFAVAFGLIDQAFAALAGVAGTASANISLMAQLDGTVQGSIAWGTTTGVTAFAGLVTALQGAGGILSLITNML